LNHKNLIASLAVRPKIGLLLPALVLLQVVIAGLNPQGAAQAEGFSDPAFQNQWNQTDQAVATGQVSRTYFWGPQPFAHTSEVYAESPQNGQREVQYYDKARMELSKKPGQAANLVTNGLLTVELVTGQMQVGDNQFLKRGPATNPVAGDQVGNPLTPTYASFNKGLLAFGVDGATKAPDRTAQVVNESVDKDGQVETFPSPPVALKYARYFDETGHNVADVFNNFFQQAPLGEDKWLSVMGYPISEAFWAKDKVIVGGQPRDVLIQLFQRRALTYTPANPAGFQVEMGNIGQHYYVWRYGFDTRDQLPGNYRLIQPVGDTLFSTNIRKPSDKINLGSAPSTIIGSWALNEGRAVVAVSGKTYLADLTKNRPFKQLTPPAGDGLDPNNIAVWRATGSADGTKVAITYSTGGNVVVQVYVLNTLGGDNLAVIDSYKAFAVQSSAPGEATFSADGRYLALPGFSQFNYFDTSTRQEYSLPFGGTSYWLGDSYLLMVTTPNVQKYDSATNTYQVVTPGKITIITAVTGANWTLVEGPYIRQAIPSPDGHYFALRQAEPNSDPAGVSDLVKSNLTFRSYDKPDTDLTPAYSQGTGGRASTEPMLVGWNADGTFVQFSSYASLTGGTNHTDLSFVSLVNGQDLKKVGLVGSYLTTLRVSLAASLYTLEVLHRYNGPEAQTDQSITLQNFDNSEQTSLYSNKVTPNAEYNDTAIRYAQVVQVPVISH
jgi:hypothetical protein